MSFLNPINKPVRLFSSTDIGAPQISYASRIAGDVKNILKSCLVTGYGAIASAGWSIENDAGGVAEFISPSAAMSDYKLSVDDNSTTSTTWYYKYQDIRVNPSYNQPVKDMTFVNKTHASNGWKLFVTDNGLVFVELLQHSTVNKLTARMTYFGQVKSGIVSASSKNMMFFNIGQNSTLAVPNYLYTANYVHLSLGDYNQCRLISSTPFTTGKEAYSRSGIGMDIASAIYVCVTADEFVVAEISGVLQNYISNSDNLYGVKEIQINGRSALHICCGYAYSGTIPVTHSRNFLIYLDYWEY